MDPPSLGLSLPPHLLGQLASPPQIFLPDSQPQAVPFDPSTPTLFVTGDFPFVECLSPSDLTPISRLRTPQHVSQRNLALCPLDLKQPNVDDTTAATSSVVLAIGEKKGDLSDAVSSHSRPCAVTLYDLRRRAARFVFSGAHRSGSISALAGISLFSTSPSTAQTTPTARQLLVSGEWVVSPVSSSPKVCLWDIVTGELVHEMGAGMSASSIVSSAYASSPCVFVGGVVLRTEGGRGGESESDRNNEYLVQFDVARGRRVGELEGHRGIVRNLFFWKDPSAPLLISTSDDGTVRMWSAAAAAAASQRCVRTILLRSEGRTAGLLRPTCCLGDESRHLLLVGMSSSIGAWDMRNVSRRLFTLRDVVADDLCQFSSDAAFAAVCRFPTQTVIAFDGSGKSIGRVRIEGGPCHRCCFVGDMDKGRSALVLENDLVLEGDALLEAGPGLGESRSLSSVDQVVAPRPRFPFRLNCPYARDCHRFVVERMGLAEAAVLDHRKDVCFCVSCRDPGDSEVWESGSGDQTARCSYPFGWTRFSLSISGAHEDQRVFDWHVAYHGTSAATAAIVLQTGATLLFSGDVLADGTRLGVVDGHFTDPAKAAFVFVSPSIKYVSSEVYCKTTPFEECGYKVAFQVRIQPNTYRVQPETILSPRDKDRGVTLDPHFHNSEIEWKTKRRNVIVLTGLLIRKVRRGRVRVPGSGAIGPSRHRPGKRPREEGASTEVRPAKRRKVDPKNPGEINHTQDDRMDVEHSRGEQQQLQQQQQRQRQVQDDAMDVDREVSRPRVRLMQDDSMDVDG